MTFTHIKSIFRTALLGGLFFSCCGPKDSKQAITAPQNPEWITKKIEEFKAGEASKTPDFIDSYQYNSQLVYYIPAPACCDQFSTLYDESGKVICHPDGGITGKGDMKCSDFVQKRMDEKVIWKDDRTN